MFKTARQSSCTCSSKLHQHNCSKSRHRKYPDKDNSPGNSGSHLPGSRGPQEGVGVHATLPEVCCGEDQISGENFLHTHTPLPPLNSVTPYERKSYPEIQMKDKHSVVSDKILLFDRKMFDLFQRMYFGNEHIFLLVWLTELDQWPWQKYWDLQGGGPSQNSHHVVHQCCSQIWTWKGEFFLPVTWQMLVTIVGV